MTRRAAGRFVYTDTAQSPATWQPYCSVGTDVLFVEEVDVF